MEIKKQLEELENKKNELLFKEIKHKNIKKGDLHVRDGSGIIPVYFREITYKEAIERINAKKSVIIISKDSKLGKIYISEKEQNETEQG